MRGLECVNYVDISGTSDNHSQVSKIKQLRKLTYSDRRTLDPSCEFRAHPSGANSPHLQTGDRSQSPVTGSCSDRITERIVKWGPLSLEKFPGHKMFCGDLLKERKYSAKIVATCLSSSQKFLFRGFQAPRNHERQ